MKRLVRKKDTGKLYALKSLRKSQVKQVGKVEQIMNERTILELVRHPFVVEMHWAF